MKEAYVERTLKKATRDLIDKANQVINKHQAKKGTGSRLTLRQVYYQLVAHHGLPNKEENYKRLGNAISEGRLCGLVDWDAIEDRTRNLRSLPTWASTGGIIRTCARAYRQDKWADQGYRPEIWVEKEALVGVFAVVGEEFEVPYIACRGYMSQSEMWAAAMRFTEYIRNGQTPYVLHFGDHDPSGIDMSRDIQDRIDVFLSKEFGPGQIEFNRLALNMPQIKTYRPPPNPAKSSDSRFQDYAVKFGHSSWELDSLDVDVLEDLAREQLNDIRDDQLWDASLAKEEEGRKVLEKAAKKWDTIVKKL